MAEIKLMNVDSITNQSNTKVEVEYIPKVVATTPAVGDVLTWNGTEWVNSPKTSVSTSKARLFFNTYMG